MSVHLFGEAEHLGYFCCRIGRKPVICFSAAMLEGLGLGVANSRNFFTFTCLRFFVSSAVSAVTITSFVLSKLSFLLDLSVSCFCYFEGGVY